MNGRSFIGYVVNMLAVPALALAGNWPMAAALMIASSLSLFHWLVKPFDKPKK